MGVNEDMAWSFQCKMLESIEHLELELKEILDFLPTIAHVVNTTTGGSRVLLEMNLAVNDVVGLAAKIRERTIDSENWK